MVEGTVKGTDKSTHAVKYDDFRIDIRNISYIISVGADNQGAIVARKPASTQPTNAELAILRVLWREGPSTVRDVHEQLQERDVGYTTVLKMLQIMTDKGLVRRDESARSHVYRAVSAEKDVKRRLVADLLDRAFEGSAASLVMHALESQPASADDLAQIRSLLNSLDKRGNP